MTNHRYPADADFDDCFDVSEEQLAAALALFDAGRKADAYDYFFEECGLERSRAQDAFGWWGRR